LKVFSFTPIQQLAAVPQILDRLQLPSTCQLDFKLDGVPASQILPITHSWHGTLQRYLSGLDAISIDFNEKYGTVLRGTEKSDMDPPHLHILAGKANPSVPIARLVVFLPSFGDTVRKLVVKGLHRYEAHDHWRTILREMRGVTTLVLDDGHSNTVSPNNRGDSETRSVNHAEPLRVLEGPTPFRPSEMLCPQLDTLEIMGFQSTEFAEETLEEICRRRANHGHRLINLII
jgi:hypothetical protein